MSAEYGPLATEVHDLDKPIGRPFADVEYYTGLLADVSGPILDPATGQVPDPASRGRPSGRGPG
jgi:hypothetical protein